MDVELALKINKLVHNECKDVPHDIGLKIEELVRLHQNEQVTAFAEWLKDNHSINIHDMILQDYIRYGG